MPSEPGLQFSQTKRLFRNSCAEPGFLGDEHPVTSLKRVSPTTAVTEGRELTSDARSDSVIPLPTLFSNPLRTASIGNKVASGKLPPLTRDAPPVHAFEGHANQMTSSGVSRLPLRDSVDLGQSAADAFVPTVMEPPVVHLLLDASPHESPSPDSATAHCVGGVISPSATLYFPGVVTSLSSSNSESLIVIVTSSPTPGLTPIIGPNAPKCRRGLRVQFVENLPKPSEQRRSKRQDENTAPFGLGVELLVEVFGAVAAESKVRRTSLTTRSSHTHTHSSRSGEA